MIVISNGITERNSVIDMATAMLGDFAEENPESNKEVKSDIRLLKSNKLGTHEAELEKIKSVFLQILKECKKDIEEGQPKYEPVTAEQFKTIKSELSNKPLQNITTEDVTNAVTDMLTAALPMNEQSTGLFKNLLASMLVPNSENEEM